MNATEGLYRPPSAYKLLPAILGLFAAFGVLSLIVRGGPPLWFTLLWFAMLGWLAANSLYRTNYELRFDDTYLFWRGFLRSGKVQLADVLAVDSEFLGSIAVFVCRDGGKIRVAVLQGFAPFLSSLSAVNPSLGAQPGLYARFVERAQLRRRARHTCLIYAAATAAEKKDYLSGGTPNLADPEATQAGHE